MAAISRRGMAISGRMTGESAGRETRAAAKSAAYSVFGQRIEAPPLASGLHVVATPIGNLADVSLRALATLAAADAVLAEDTRVSRTLLAHYGVATPLVAYHEHNGAAARPGIIERLRGGAALALVSDAGTPLVSDPGYKLVADAIAGGIDIFGVPGASAVMAALTVAGLPTDRFFFEGFLPPKSAARRQRLAELAAIPGTLVFFESPRRVAETCADIAAVLGPRETAIARELTKHFESVRRGTAAELAAALAGEEPPKGEIVLLVGPPAGDGALIEAGDCLDARIRAALAKHSVKDAASVVSAESGQPRRLVYARAIEIAAADRES